ncbi:MAG: SH3 domain-containing protein [Oscillospiraceae bacterium]|nr:SH3 domain-containing protein [Oscillospiraceae bacterium]
MNQKIRFTGIILLIAVLVLSLAACGERNTVPAADTPSVPPSEIVIETPPPSPSPTPTPTPSAVPSVSVTTVPMPMPSVSPTVSVATTPDPAASPGASASPAASPTVSPSPSASPSPTPTPYSPDANFASTINPDGYFVPDNAVPGYLNANGVVLHGGPSNSARTLGTFDVGTPVDIIGVENGWTEVIIGGLTGYVKSNYVTGGSYGSGPAVIYDDPSAGSGGVIIVPAGESRPAQGTPDPNPSNFLGIMPD